MRRFAVTPLPAVSLRVALPDDAAHHFRDVLRGRIGEHIELFDGTGGRAVAVVTHIDAHGVQVQVTSHRHDDATARHILILSVLKGPAMDTAVRMATEAGATDIWPVLASRTVATGDRSDRWKRIVSTAAQQCGRASVPDVRSPQPLVDAISAVGDCALYVAHPTVADTPVPMGDCAVLVGPEGGWTEDEVALARRHGAQALRLGPFVLRADTAAAVATAWMAQNHNGAG